MTWIVVSIHVSSTCSTCFSLSCSITWSMGMCLNPCNQCYGLWCKALLNIQKYNWITYDFVCSAYWLCGFANPRLQHGIRNYNNTVGACVATFLCLIKYVQNLQYDQMYCCNTYHMAPSSTSFVPLTLMVRIIKQTCINFCSSTLINIPKDVIFLNN